MSKRIGNHLKNMGILLILLIILIRVINPDTSHTINGETYCYLWQHGIVDWNALNFRCSW